MDDNRSTEIRIKEICVFAEELRKTLGMDLETDVNIGLFEESHWYGKVFPSILILGNTKKIALTHSYSAKTLDDLLFKMLEGTKEELVNAKNGKARCLS